jgi:hypothetical protein
MQVTVTIKELEAINSAIGMLSEALQTAGEEFIRTSTPELLALENLRKKCLRSKKRDAFKEWVRSKKQERLKKVKNGE